MTSLESAREQIRGAFAAVPHPGEGGVGHCALCNHETDVQMVEAAESWGSLSPFALRGMSLGFFSPEGFRFALPALMLHALDVWDTDDPAVDNAIWGLAPPDVWDGLASEAERQSSGRSSSPERIVAWHSRTGILSAEQRSAVMSFLAALADVAGLDQDLRVNALAALAWWRAHIPE